MSEWERFGREVDASERALGVAVEQIRIFVPGKPIPLSRTSAGQFGGRYLAPASSKQIGAIVDAWERQGEPRFPDDAPLRLTASFVFERPASHFGTGRNAGRLKPSARPEFISRPDTSNLIKLVEDALNGNAFKDDSRIVAITARKSYGERAGTEIMLRRAA